MRSIDIFAMKNSLKYIYIIGIVWLIGFATNIANAAGCDAWFYNRGWMWCVSKFCIWHSDAYCNMVKSATDKATTRAADIKECEGWFYDPKTWAYKQKWTGKFCECLADGGTELAIAIPFVWIKNPDGTYWRCVPKAEAGEAVPTLIYSIIQILNTFLLVGGFTALIYAWVLYTTQWFNDEKQLWKAKTIIWWVIGAFALYGTLWLILKLINPNIFQ